MGRSVDTQRMRTAKHGHSYGAVCSLEATLRTPRVRRLALYEPPLPIGIEIYPPGLIERLGQLLYAMDRRGRGASADAEEYSIEREFDDVAAVIDAIGGDVDVLVVKAPLSASMTGAQRVWSALVPCTSTSGGPLPATWQATAVPSEDATRSIPLMREP
jgi:hypothetical protein